MTNEVINKYPNPWNFDNSSNELTSPNKFNKIEYVDLREIVMGGPLCGYCIWKNKNGKNLKMNELFGGPVIWNSEGTKVAIPTWTKKFLKGTVQQISVLDIQKREIIKYKKTFNVLDLRTFSNNEICGYDSPIYNTKIVKFDLDYEKIVEKKEI